MKLPRHELNIDQYLKEVEEGVLDIKGVTEREDMDEDTD